MPQSRLTHSSSSTCRPGGDQASEAIGSTEVSVVYLEKELNNVLNFFQMLSWHRKRHYTLQISPWTFNAWLAGQCFLSTLVYFNGNMIG